VIKPAPSQWIRLPALKLSFPPPETFHVRNTVVLVGQNPRPTRCGTPSRRFRDYDSEPRGWFPKIPVTEAGADAKLKFAQQKYKPKLVRKKRPQTAAAPSFAHWALRSRSAWHHG
jgi:hypothetical protein